MARFYGKVGYADTQEQPPNSGIWKNVITEIDYYGDVIRDTRRLSISDVINPDISVGNSISIIADAYANEHFFAMRYVEWAGVRWIVSEVEVQRPRLILRLGGVYNGPTP